MSHRHNVLNCHHYELALLGVPTVGTIPPPISLHTGTQMPDANNPRSCILQTRANVVCITHTLHGVTCCITTTQLATHRIIRCNGFTHHRYTHMMWVVSFTGGLHNTHNVWCACRTNARPYHSLYYSSRKQICIITVSRSLTVCVPPPQRNDAFTICGHICRLHNITEWVGGMAPHTQTVCRRTFI